MDIKPVPTTQVANSVKETGEEKRQAPGQDTKQKKSTKAPKPADAINTQEQESTPEAADAALRASQPMDTQTTLDLLTHPPKAPHAAKFPTPPKTYGPPSGAKKLNRSA
jgi:hypothetical protein